FVRGLTHATVERLARRTRVEIAIVNPDDAFVLGGRLADLSEFVAAALQAGAARSGLLPVTIAAHTSMLAAAVEPFQAAILARQPRDPAASALFLSALDGSPQLEAAAAAASLA